MSFSCSPEVFMEVHCLCKLVKVVFLNINIASDIFGRSLYELNYKTNFLKSPKQPTSIRLYHFPLFSHMAGYSRPISVRLTYVLHAQDVCTVSSA